MGREKNAASHSLWLSPTETKGKQSARIETILYKKKTNKQTNKTKQIKRTIRDGCSPCLKGHTESFNIELFIEALQSIKKHATFYKMALTKAVVVDKVKFNIVQTLSKWQPYCLSH